MMTKTPIKTIPIMLISLLLPDNEFDLSLPARPIPPREHIGRLCTRLSKGNWRTIGQFKHNHSILQIKHEPPAFTKPESKALTQSGRAAKAPRDKAVKKQHQPPVLHLLDFLCASAPWRLCVNDFPFCPLFNQAKTFPALKVYAWQKRIRIPHLKFPEYYDDTYCKRMY